MILLILVKWTPHMQLLPVLLQCLRPIPHQATRLIPVPIQIFTLHPFPHLTIHPLPHPLPLPLPLPLPPHRPPTVKPEGLGTDSNKLKSLTSLKRSSRKHHESESLFGTDFEKPFAPVDWENFAVKIICSWDQPWKFNTQIKTFMQRWSTNKCARTSTPPEVNVQLTPDSHSNTASDTWLPIPVSRLKR